MSEAERRTEELSAFLDGDLESGPAAELRERLERDPELRAELESLRRTVEAVRNLPAERAPAELRERLAASLSSEAAPALKRGRLVGIGGWVAGVSAVAASLLIAAFLFNGSRQDAPVDGGWKSAAKKQRAKQDEPARQDEFEKAFERAQTETRSLDDRETVAGGTVSVETVAVAKDAARPGAFRGSNSAVPPGRRTPSDPLPPKAPAENAPDSARSALEATGRRQAEGEREEINKLAEKMRKEVKLAERDRAPQPAGEPSTQQEEVKKLAADKAVRNSRLKQQQENALRTLRQDAAAKAGDEAQAAGLVKLDLSLLASADRKEIVASLQATAGTDQSAAFYFQSDPQELIFKVRSAEEARHLTQVLLTLSVAAPDDDAGVLLGGVLDRRRADKEDAWDEGKAQAPESRKRENLDELTARNEVLTTSTGGGARVTFEVRLPAAEASLVGRWGARLFPYEPPPATVQGKSAGARFGEADADAADEEGEVEEGAGEEDAGEGFAARERKKSAPAPDPGVGGAAAPAGAKAAERSLGGSKNERNALRERLIRIVILYPKGAKLKPSPSPAAESKGK